MRTKNLGDAHPDTYIKLKSMHQHRLSTQIQYRKIEIIFNNTFIITLWKIAESWLVHYQASEYKIYSINFIDHKAI